ncbi:MAG: galactose mutarotase [Oscillospiraceae bacterium]|nr:galactose mutarotase [Oscillospiraceae bacterium]
MIVENEFCGYRSFTVTNGEFSLRLTEYGATALSLNRGGQELLLGFDTIEAYERSTAFIGAIVGRWANRIGRAAFNLNGETFKVCANEGGNCLHGGDENRAWNKRRWTAAPEGENSVSFSLLSPDGDNGFPGELSVRVIYTLLPDRLRIDFTGVSDRDTYFCPTSHIYFSLGEENILGAEMQINASGHLEVDEALIPTGKILPAEGAFDFSAARTIERDFDDCFVLTEPPACVVKTDKVKLTLYTDYPALQFYTGKYLDCGIAPNAGLAIEPEFFPDTPNRPEFPDALLRAGEQFSKYLEFVFE